MTEEDKSILNYLVLCIGKFADRYEMNRHEAYKYLQKYKGIDFLIDCYDAEHTLGLEDAIDDITAICNKNGGTIK